jgi:hypothetical protein
MAEQREATQVKSELTTDQLQEELNKRVEARRKLKEGLRVNLLDRAAVSTALDLSWLPKGLSGQWCRNETLRINDLRALNYEVYKDNSIRGLHDANADGSVVVGDLILMTCSRENREIIDELRKEEYNQRHGKPGDNQLQLEEKAFMAEQNTLIGSHIGTANESRVTKVPAPTSTS